MKTFEQKLDEFIKKKASKNWRFDTERIAFCEGGTSLKPIVLKLHYELEEAKEVITCAAAEINHYFQAGCLPTLDDHTMIHNYLNHTIKALAEIDKMLEVGE